MIRYFLALFLLLSSAPAFARRVPLDPQNRAHLGVSLADTTSFGIAGGLDSRLTRLIYVDVAGFVSPFGVPDLSPDSTPRQDPAAWFALRHGLYVTPGIRLPHRSQGKWSWDVVGRVGFGVVWSSDTADENNLYTDPALVAGGEFLIRHEQVGLRASARGFFFRPFSRAVAEEISLIRPQMSLEVFYQW